MTSYQALKTRAAELCLPRSFKTDLTKHDRAALADRDPAEPFGWVLYEHGTHLVWDASACPKTTSFGREEILHCHFWDGVRLHSVANLAALEERLAAAFACQDCGCALVGDHCPECARQACEALEAWERSQRATA